MERLAHYHTRQGRGQTPRNEVSSERERPKHGDSSGREHGTWSRYQRVSRLRRLPPSHEEIARAGRGSEDKWKETMSALRKFRRLGRKGDSSKRQADVDVHVIIVQDFVCFVQVHF